MAELSLACVSLLFQAFSGCVQGYELITDARHMPSDCQYLRVRMKVEQYRLVDWAEYIRLDYTDDELIFNSTTKAQIMEILEQQRKLLHQFGRMDVKYKKLSKPLLTEIEEDFTADSDHLLENGFAGPERRESNLTRFPEASRLFKTSLEFTKKFKEVPKRLKWATWDKEKMEALIAKCSVFNDKMVEALTQTQLHDLRNRQERTNYQIMQLNSSVQSLVQIFKSQALTVHLGRGQRRIHRQAQGITMSITNDDDTDNDMADSSSSLSSTPSSPIETLAALAQTKALNYAIEDPRELTPEFTQSISLRRSPSTIRDASLSQSDIELQQPVADDLPESHRTEAYYIDKSLGRKKKISVWIEWKTYEPTTFQPSGLDPKIEERVKKLSALLKENNNRSHTFQFRAPKCLGYFQDEDEGRFGLVFEKPPECHASTEPISLHALLTDESIPMPSLTERITLMRLLSETIERLHAVDWLHKGLRSANILFFADGGASEINYSDPYISGFDYSRPAMSDDMTEKPPDNAASDVYRHPVVQTLGNRGAFRKSFDIYSLGVILLEICYWKPIDAILDIDLAKARPSITYKVRERLLEEPRWKQYVKGHLGNTVERVVWACLVGPKAFGLEDGCDEKRGEVGAVLQSKFYEEVVSGLAGMRV